MSCDNLPTSDNCKHANVLLNYLNINLKYQRTRQVNIFVQLTKTFVNPCYSLFCLMYALKRIKIYVYKLTSTNQDELTLLTMLIHFIKATLNFMNTSKINIFVQLTKTFVNPCYSLFCLMYALKRIKIYVYKLTSTKQGELTLLTMLIHFIKAI